MYLHRLRLGRLRLGHLRLGAVGSGSLEGDHVVGRRGGLRRLLVGLLFGLPLARLTDEVHGLGGKALGHALTGEGLSEESLYVPVLAAHPRTSLSFFLARATHE